MRWREAAAAICLAACYAEPATAPTCTITCVDSCPADMACVHGYCVGAGDSCEPTFRATSAGTGFACALDTQDLLWCWGGNTYHQLDPSEIDLIPRARQILGTQRFDSISTGGGHICGLRDGRLSCWGRNDRGQVSDLIAGDVTAPLEIAAPNGQPWTFVAAGYNNTCAIASGQLYCWGAGDTGQLGNGTTGDIGTPTAVETTLTDWTLVDTNSGRYYISTSTMMEPWAHSCAISQSAGLYCWGLNYYGELGDGTQTPRLTPVSIALPSAPTHVAVAQWSTCATTDTGEVYCWGVANYGALGDPAVVEPQLGGAPLTRTPIRASNLTGFTKLEANEWLTCALRDREVWCWGWTYAGGLGHGLFEGSHWGKVADNVTDVSVGWNANIDDTGFDSYDLDLACILVDGAVQCWGDNRYGQLGQGGATMHPVPKEVTGDHRFSAIAAGGAHACGIEDGNLLCWGSTRHGQANGVIAGTQQVPCGSAPGLVCNVPAPMQVTFAPTADEVSLGLSHSCARTGSSITCWGDNRNLQLGQSATVGPVTLSGAWTKLLDVGTNGQCAVQNGSETWCWGTVLATPTPAQRVTTLDAMARLGASGMNDGLTPLSFGCALDAANKLVCWGANDLGQYGNGVLVGGACGNGMCDSGETSGWCPQDCGNGPLSKLGRSYSALAVSWPTYFPYAQYVYNITPYACGVRVDGKIECWGYTYLGGLGPVGPEGYLPTATVLDGLIGCTAVTASNLHTCAICSGDIYCWGDHRFGAVGAGPITTVPISTPRKVDIALQGDTWTQLVSGVGFSCARTHSGRAYCWGFSRDGALGSGGASSPSPVTVRVDP